MGASSPPEEPDQEMESTKTSLNFHFKYSNGLPPALRSVRPPVAMWVPWQQFCIRTGLALSVFFMKLKGWKLALPPPAPPVAEPMVVLLAAPKLKEKISISPLCLASLDSPVTPSSFKNASNAIRVLLLFFQS